MMPAFLLDQMIDLDVATTLRSRGFDVIRAGEVGLAKASDDEILEWAREHGRILVTLDEHFGDWAVLPLSGHHGVIRIKAIPTSGTEVLKVILPFLSLHSVRDFTNTLVIVSEKRSRWIRTK